MFLMIPKSSAADAEANRRFPREKKFVQFAGLVQQINPEMDQILHTTPSWLRDSANQSLAQTLSQRCTDRPMTVYFMYPGDKSHQLRFEDLKANINRFDQAMLTEWQQIVEQDRELNFYSYIIGVPDFPEERTALVSPPNFLSLHDIAVVPDPSERSEISIPMGDMQARFGFSATPVDRISWVKKHRHEKHHSRDSDKNKDKRDHDKPKKTPYQATTGRMPGHMPKSISTNFPKKK